MRSVHTAATARAQGARTSPACRARWGTLAGDSRRVAFVRASVAAVPSARLSEHPGRGGTVGASPYASWLAATPGRIVLDISRRRPPVLIRLRRIVKCQGSSYGPMIHLRLLRTPPHDDALTFGYRPESTCLGRTPTSRIEYTLRRTIPSTSVICWLRVKKDSKCLFHAGIKGWENNNSLVQGGISSEGQ